MSYEMSIEDWTLFSDHLLSIIRDINAVIAYQHRDLKSLRKDALNRILANLNELTSHIEKEIQSSEQTAREE